MTGRTVSGTAALRRAVAFVLVSTLCALGLAAPETFETLAQKADSIIIGKCTAKSCVVRRGIFITTHQVQVTESLKGKAVRPGQTISVASLGGQFSSPPLSQYVNDQPEIIEGEDVLLFLQNPPSNTKGKSTLAPELAASARVIGGGKGKFSIITDPKDNQRKVVKVRCEDYGMMADDRLLRTILRALEKGELETTDPKSLVDLGAGVRGPESAKPILDNAVRITESLQKPNADKLAQQMRANTAPIPAPSLDEVKAKIAEIVNKQK